LGLLHTHAWLTASARLQRLISCLNHSSTQEERDSLADLFALQLVEQAKQYSQPAAAGWQPANELNTLAVFVVASIFDRIVSPRVQTTPQVRALLPESGKEDAALQSAWSLFMQQASSSIGGGLGTIWTAGGPTGPAAGPPGKASSPPSPTSPCGRPPRLIGPSESRPGPDSPFAHRGVMPRNGSEIFAFEQ